MQRQTCGYTDLSNCNTCRPTYLSGARHADLGGSRAPLLLGLPLDTKDGPPPHASQPAFVLRHPRQPLPLYHVTLPDGDGIPAVGQHAMF